MPIGTRLTDQEIKNFRAACSQAGNFPLAHLCSDALMRDERARYRVTVIMAGGPDPGRDADPEPPAQAAYRLNHFTAADAYRLVGRDADITQWDDDEMERKVAYPGARVTGVLPTLDCLVIEPRTAVVTDAVTGETLSERGAPGPLNVGFAWICQIGNVRPATGPTS